MVCTGTSVPYVVSSLRLFIYRDIDGRVIQSVWMIYVQKEKFVSQNLYWRSVCTITEENTQKFILDRYLSRFRGTRWRSWLRHCATSRKVAGSIADGVGIFHWHNPSGCTMALGLTQPLTEMSTSNISWGQRQPVRRADNLTTFMCQLSWNLRASTSWNPQGLSRPVMGLLYIYFSFCCYLLSLHILVKLTHSTFVLTCLSCTFK